MSYQDRCFFCCKIIQQNIYFGDVDANTDFKSREEHVLRISQYLKIPNEIKEENEEISTTIKTCQDCSAISQSLNELFTQLDTINLKINHYFNQLADQILEIPTSEDDNDNQDEDGGGQLNLSSFQKMVHEKCLFKVQQDSCDPQIDLQNSSPSDSPVILDDSIEIKQQIKIESVPIIEGQSLNQEINQDLHSCPFCDFLVEGPYNLLHSHITAQHPEHFQTDDLEETFPVTEINPSSSTSAVLDNSTCQICHKKLSSFWNIQRHMITVHGKPRNRMSPPKKSAIPSKPTIKTMTICDSCGKTVSTFVLAKHKRLFCKGVKKLTKVLKVKEFKCSSCGTSFVNRGNLRRHLREMASCAQDQPNQLNLHQDRFQCSNCQKGYSRLDYIKKHIETECKAGLLIDHDSGTKLTLEEVSQRISKCEYCGYNVYTKNLGKHKASKHKDGLVKKSWKRPEEIIFIVEGGQVMSEDPLKT